MNLCVYTFAYKVRNWIEAYWLNLLKVYVDDYFSVLQAYSMLAWIVIYLELRWPDFFHSDLYFFLRMVKLSLHIHIFVLQFRQRFNACDTFKTYLLQLSWLQQILGFFLFYLCVKVDISLISSTQIHQDVLFRLEKKHS